MLPNRRAGAWRGGCCRGQAAAVPSPSEGFTSVAALSCNRAMMIRSRARLAPLFAGLAIAALQVTVATGLLAPEGSFSQRYATLIQHDSHWFANIVDRGYQTIVPPIDHKVMEVSNVAFFPAYPAVAALLRYGLNIPTGAALLIASQLAACGFWSYFFLLCKRWKVSPALQVCGALLVLAHPAAFFLVAAYSESLFLMGLLGFIYWSAADGWRARGCAALHGLVMSAARIVGLVCAAFPVVRSVFQTGCRGFSNFRKCIGERSADIGLMLAALSGGLFFLLYCQLRWGRWDLYMLTQAAGWGIEPDYLAVFKPENYRWLIPALDNPTEASQMAMTLGALLLIAVLFCELIPAIRRRAGWPTRAGIYFCAAAIYYLSVSGVACVDMESMLRYEFCAHALIVLAFLNFLQQCRTPPLSLRAFGIGAVALLTAAGLCVQGWYVWNFTRGNWVA